MKKSFLILIFTLISFVVSACDNTKVSIQVVNESGAPLQDVGVGVGFETNASGGTKTKAQHGKSDENGYFSASGRTNGHIGFSGSKEGYYRSSYVHNFAHGNEPWEKDFKIVMREIGDPVPMYARNIQMSSKKIELPILGEEVGFDLVVYDWVAPYGEGTSADFIFNGIKDFKDKRNFSAKVTLTFPGQKDGIIVVSEDLSQGSELKLPRYAPINGYENNLVFDCRSEPGKLLKTNFNETDNFIFRVRSKYEDGQLVEAKYGKIHGPLYLDAVWSETLRVYFSYYFNPDGTRNLEFDPKKNLFVDLSDLERVGLR